MGNVGHVKGLHAAGDYLLAGWPMLASPLLRATCRRATHMWVARKMWVARLHSTTSALGGLGCGAEGLGN